MLEHWTFSTLLPRCASRLSQREYHPLIRLICDLLVGTAESHNHFEGYWPPKLNMYTKIWLKNIPKFEKLVEKILEIYYIENTFKTLFSIKSYMMSINLLDLQGYLKIIGDYVKNKILIELKKKKKIIILKRKKRKKR